MSFTPRPLESHVNWRAADVADPAQWTVELTPADHRELDAALANAKGVSSELLHEVMKSKLSMALAGCVGVVFIVGELLSSD